MRIDSSTPLSLPESAPTPGSRPNARPFVEVLKEQSRAAPAVESSAGAVADPAVGKTGPGLEAVKGLLEQATQAEKKMDHRLAEVAKGKVYSPQELIALQVDAFRYSQSVEVVSRVTDKVVGGIKQILSIQV